MGTTQVPKEFAYLHEDCGTVTTVGGSIVSNMHYDPYYYMAGMTVCASCGEVPDSRCTLVDTGQNLDEYCRELKKTKGTGYHVVRWSIWVVFMIAGAILAPILGENAKGQIPQPWESLFGAMIGGLAALFIGRFIRLMLCKIGLI